MSWGSFVLPLVSLGSFFLLPLAFSVLCVPHWHLLCVHTCFVVSCFRSPLKSYAFVLHRRVSFLVANEQNANKTQVRTHTRCQWGTTSTAHARGERKKPPLQFQTQTRWRADKKRITAPNFKSKRCVDKKSWEKHTFWKSHDFHMEIMRFPHDFHMEVMGLIWSFPNCRFIWFIGLGIWIRMGTG